MRTLKYLKCIFGFKGGKYHFAAMIVDPAKVAVLFEVTKLYLSTKKNTIIKQWVDM